jgi:PAS domain S-box-containing protein
MKHEPRSCDLDHEHGIRIPAAELQALRHAIAEAADPRLAGEILFEMGQRLGQREAGRLLTLGASGRAVLEDGFARLAALGLGVARLETFELDAARGDCRIVGQVIDTLEQAKSDGGGTPDGSVCEVTVGYLTGLAATVTGLDVVCTPFQCAQTCAPCGCPFEIRPAHKEADAANASGPAPSGSARFFLRTMGRTLAGTDISLDELVENGSDAVILIDNDEVIRFWNRGAERMFLYPRAEVVGRKVGFLVPADLQASNELGWIQKQLARGSALRNHVTRRVRKDGKELTVSLSRAILRDSAGHSIGSTATIRDITDQRRTEEELARARGLALIGELSAKVAHEIKNPLAGIYAAVQLLARDLPASDGRRPILDSIGAEVRRLDETVQDLLRFGRPTPARPRPAGLRSFAGELVESLRRNPDLQRHQVRIEIDDEIVVPLDSRLLGQALGNLVLNAAQAMEQPGTITVSAARDERAVTIAVADTGPGIPTNKLAEIFEPFFTTKTRGTGLGLPIARRNVEAHGGTLAAESRPAGGALFRIVLPAATP